MQCNVIKTHDVEVSAEAWLSEFRSGVGEVESVNSLLVSWLESGLRETFGDRVKSEVYFKDRAITGDD